MYVKFWQPIQCYFQDHLEGPLEQKVSKVDVYKVFHKTQEVKQEIFFRFSIDFIVCADLLRKLTYIVKFTCLKYEVNEFFSIFTFVQPSPESILHTPKC